MTTIKASIVKLGKGLALAVEPIPLSAVANVTPDPKSGLITRATMIHATNRSMEDGQRVTIPVKGLKAEAPYVAVTLSVDLESAEKLGLNFNVREKSASVAKGKGKTADQLRHRNGTVRTRRATAAEMELAD